MLITAALILVVTAFILTLISASKPDRVPLWVAVLLLCVAMFVGVYKPS